MGVPVVQQGGAEPVLLEEIVRGTQSSVLAVPATPRYHVPATTLNVYLDERSNDQRVLAKAEALESFRGAARHGVRFIRITLHTTSATLASSVTSFGVDVPDQNLGPVTVRWMR